MFGRRKLAALVAEFLGTGVLTLLVLSVQRSTIGVPFFVALAAGLTVSLMVFAFGGLSGAILNPALTLALWTARKLQTLTALLYIVLEFLGAWAAYYLYTYFVNSPLQPIGGHFTSRVLVAEAVGAFLFSLGWAASLYQGYTRAVSASVAGLAFMLGLIASSSASVGLINPALALGVRAWIWGTYVLGPVLGALVGVNLYGLLFAGPAETVVAGEAAVVATKPVASSAVAAPVRKRSGRKTAGRTAGAAAARTASTRTASRRRTTAASRSTTPRRRSNRAA